MPSYTMQKHIQYNIYQADEGTHPNMDISLTSLLLSAARDLIWELAQVV